MQNRSPQTSQADRERVSMLLALEETESALIAMQEMTALEIALLQLEHPEWLPATEELMPQLNAAIMMEVTCLWAVVGQPPYETAREMFGLSETAIEQYQSQWRQANLNPAEIEYPDGAMEPMEIAAQALTF